MSWPSTLVAYKRTDTFTQDTIPAGLRRAHTTKAGVWALIRVLEGELQFAIEGEIPEILSKSNPGLVEPEIPHHVDPIGPVKFYIEFFRDASTGDPDDDELT